MWVWGGMVFQALPLCRCVTPITSWQLRAPSRWMYLQMVRWLTVSGAPMVVALAWAFFTSVTGKVACAG